MPTFSQLKVNGSGGINQWFNADWTDIEFSDQTYAVDTLNGGSKGASATFASALQGMPADFGSMDTLEVYVEVNSIGLPSTLGVMITTSGGTVLAGATGSSYQEVTSSGSTGAFTVPFDYVDTSATKADWDTAELRLRHTVSAGMSGSVDVDYADLDGTYSIASGSVPNAPTLVSPTDGEEINMGAGYTFDWTHNDPDGDPQVAYRFLRRREV